VRFHGHQDEKGWSTRYVDGNHLGRPCTNFSGHAIEFFRVIDKQGVAVAVERFQLELVAELCFQEVGGLLGLGLVGEQPRAICLYFGKTGPGVRNPLPQACRK
jgi:hypothetical protein